MPPLLNSPSPHPHLTKASPWLHHGSRYGNSLTFTPHTSLISSFCLSLDLHRLSPNTTNAPLFQASCHPLQHDDAPLQASQDPASIACAVSTHAITLGPLFQASSLHGH